MDNRHWSDEDFVARLYDVGPDDDHLESCAECMQRWEKHRLRRQLLLASTPQVPAGFLDGQRRSILGLLQEPPRAPHFRLAPALTAILLILVVITIFRPAPRQQYVEIVPDEQLFEEVFSLVSTSEPQAVEPLRSLFEVPQ
jgi:hypothetical protein